MVDDEWEDDYRSGAYGQRVVQSGKAGNKAHHFLNWLDIQDFRSMLRVSTSLFMKSRTNWMYAYGDRASGIPFIPLRDVAGWEHDSTRQ